MAFGVKQIKALLSENGMPVENLDKVTEEICGRHTADLDAIKEQRDSFKAEAEQKDSIQKELDNFKAQVEADAKNREGKDYDALKAEFDNYKKEQEAKAVKSAKETALKELLKDMKMSDRGEKQVLKWMGVDGFELDENGKIKDASTLRKSIKEDWGDYIQTEGAKGADTPTPPGGTGGGTGKTKKEIMQIKDAKERQQAIADNPELFGLPAKE